MMRTILLKPAVKKCMVDAATPLLNFCRGMHSRNQKAMEFIAKGYGILKEVDRVVAYGALRDGRLVPQLMKAKELFELALEADNSNTHARYWLSRIHFRYFIPCARKDIGTVLLMEAAEMGDPQAQYEVGHYLRVKDEYVQSVFQKKRKHFEPEQESFHYLEKAADQLYPPALYLLGAVYLAGDCVEQDVPSALWCFHRASKKGHEGAAIAYGSLLLKGVEIPESLLKLEVKNRVARRKLKKNVEFDRFEMAREQFEKAANAGSDLGLLWLKRLEEQEKEELSSRLDEQEKEELLSC